MDYPSGQKIRVVYDANHEDRVERIYDPASKRGAYFSYDGNGRITTINIDTPSGANHVDYTINGSANLTAVTVNDAAHYSYAYVSGTHNIEQLIDANGNYLEEITYYATGAWTGRAWYVETADHEYTLQYNDTTGTATITDAKTGVVSHISYDKLTHRMLSSDQCLGSCSSADGGAYLYDGYNNRIIDRNNSSITQSFYDYRGNLKGKKELSSLEWVDNDDSFTDDFEDPDLNGLNWRALTGSIQEGGTWSVLPGDTLKIGPLYHTQLIFSSKDRIRLKNDFEVKVKYNIASGGNSMLILTVKNDEDSSFNWVKMRAANGEFNWNFQYYNDVTEKWVLPASTEIGYASRSSQEGYLIIRRISDVIYLSAKDGLLSGETLLFRTDTGNTSNQAGACPDCVFSKPMFIEFGGELAPGDLKVDSIVVSGDSVSHWEAAPVADQPVETYTYNMASGNSISYNTLLSVSRESLHGDSVTTTIFDYDNDHNSNPNQYRTSKHINQIIKRGWTDTDLDGELEAGSTVYTCFYYYPYYYTPAEIRGKIMKEYKPSTQAGCSASGAPFTKYEYYTTGVGDHNTGDLQYKCECTSSNCSCASAAIKTEFLSYDDLGYATTVEDANGNTVEYAYDPLGHMTTQNVHDGSTTYTTEYTYSGDILTQVEKPLGNVIKYSYNQSGDPRMTAMGRYLTSSSQTPIESMSFQYGSTTFHEEETGALWKLTYYKTASGDTVRKVYEENGTTVFNTVKRKFQKTVEGATGSGQSQVTTLTIFDDNGNPIVKKVNPGLADGQTVSYEYNALNQLATVTDAAGNTVGYEYDIHGNLQEINAHNTGSTQTTTYAYDDFGRLIKSQSPDAGATYYKYDVKNNLISKKDARGTTINYTYDSLNRLTKIDYPDDYDIIYHYDGEHFSLYTSGYHVEPSATNALGRLTGVQVGDTISNPVPRYTTYEYDKRGNVIHSDAGFHDQYGTYNFDYYTSYAYDANGNLASLSYNGRTVTYTAQTGDPDRVDAVESYLVATIGGSTTHQHVADDIAYHPFGDIKTMTYANGLEYANSVDKRYFPKRITAGTYLNDRMDFIYTPGPRGNIASIENDQDSDRDQAFTYDIKDQLIAASGAYGTFAWTYDALGNRLQQGHTIAGQNGDTTTYSYTSATNRLTQAAKVSSGQTVRTDVFSYDDSGSISQDYYYVGVADHATVVLENNDDSRLASGTIYHGSTVYAEEEYIYDHLGQRIMKIGEAPTYYAYDIFGNFFAELDMDGDPINTYVYLGNHRLAMLGGTVGGSFWCGIGRGAADGLKANWAIIIILPVIILLALKYRRNKYVVTMLVIMGGSAIILIAMNEAGSTLTYNEAIYYYHNDHLGTPQVMTDADGVVRWDASYEPFGKINNLEVSYITNRFRFPGQYQDDMTGMYYNVHRYYFPNLGSYNRYDPYNSVNIDKDPISTLPSYLYVVNNPIRNIDRYGLLCSNCDDCPSGRWSGALGYVGGAIILGITYINGWLDCWGNSKSVHIRTVCVSGGDQASISFGLQGSLPITSSCCNKSDFAGYSGGGVTAGGWLLFGAGFSLDIGTCINAGPSFGVGLGGGWALQGCRTRILN